MVKCIEGLCEKLKLRTEDSVCIYLYKTRQVADNEMHPECSKNTRVFTSLYREQFQVIKCTVEVWVHNEEQVASETVYDHITLKIIIENLDFANEASSSASECKQLNGVRRTSFLRKGKRCTLNYSLSNNVQCHFILQACMAFICECMARHS